MAKNMNRFAMLSMDDDSSDETNAPKIIVEAPKDPLPPVEKTESFRKWGVDEGRPTETREWGIQGNSRGRKNGPFSRYSFKDDKYRSNVPRKYAFRDDSPPPFEERQKPPTPVSPPYRNVTSNVSTVTDLQNKEEFPALSDYERPHTPPYPPDDGFYPTLAERVKISLEKKEQDFKEEVKTIEMDTVIPIHLNLNKQISF